VKYLEMALRLEDMTEDAKEPVPLAFLAVTRLEAWAESSFELWPVGRVLLGGNIVEIEGGLVRQLVRINQ
jgi:hypothetical protein